MELKIYLDEREAREIIDGHIYRTIREYVEPKVLSAIKDSISNEEVAKIILERIRECFRYVDNGGINGLSSILDERIKEVSDRITDEDLKRALINRFLNKIQ